MKHLGNIAIIGTGATTVYLLNHIEKNADTLRGYIDSITLFEKTKVTGCGMPYHPETTDRYNMANISSEELPNLPETFYEWLKNQEPENLRNWEINPDSLDESEVYPRLPLGQYLRAQYKALKKAITDQGIPIKEICETHILDIQPHQDGTSLDIIDSKANSRHFNTVLISTGHHWAEEDKPDIGHYQSPWPMSKLLPKENALYNFPIGTLGASLSAFDVLSSLAHRQGKFESIENDRFLYHPKPGTEDFKIVMHTSKGWLPHLQFDQDEPFRELYRHVTRDELQALQDDEGFLRLETYFDKVCRPALITAYQKDEMPDMVTFLENPKNSLADYTKKASKDHQYKDAFAGMRSEMAAARDSVLNHKPIHWQEILDDLMFTLNFHAELMPAEDHLAFRKQMMPFLMSVIAAMPLPSAEMMLAMHDVGALEIIPGYVDVQPKSGEDGGVTVTVENEGNTTAMHYKMFIDCSGQKPLELSEYPFPTLVDGQHVSRARAIFADPKNGDLDDEHVFQLGSSLCLHTGGIEIDSSYRVVAEDGTPDDRIYDLAFPHTTGPRPYSYGLQACDAAADIVISSWLRSIKTHKPISGEITEVTKIYKEITPT